MSMRSTLLFIEDDQDIITFIRLCFRSGFEIFTAAEASAAINCMRRRPVQLVLVDLDMPLAQGNALLREIGESAKLACIPLVVICPFENWDKLAEEVQIAAVLPRPFSVSLLRYVIAETLERSQSSISIAPGNLPGRKWQNLLLPSFLGRNGRGLTARSRLDTALE
jgi:DNA-binding NtrC family response regulator